MTQIFDSVDLSSPIQVMDVGAAAINEVPPYNRLLELGWAHLSAFEGDTRQIARIFETYGASNATVFNHFLFDGSLRDVHLCSPASGMTSLYKPKQASLKFFNNFEAFGKTLDTKTIQTTRLDDVDGLAMIDFVKMDIQGAELTVLRHGTNRLRDCLALQIEVSFIALYEDQPSFGDVDVYMRSKGFVPHQFVHLKRWSIAPTVFSQNFRVGGNQLLEADMIYIRDPLRLDLLSDLQVTKLAIMAHYIFGSTDLCTFLVIEMEKRGLAPASTHRTYAESSGCSVWGYT